MRNMICIHCEEELQNNDYTYSTPEGLVCSQCIEEFLEDKWDELNITEKLQLMGFQDSCELYGDRIKNDLIDLKYEYKLDMEEAI